MAVTISRRPSYCPNFATAPLKVLEPELDTSRSADKLMVNILSSLAEWERDLIRERTRDGVAYARSQGRVAGRKLKLSIEQAKAARNLFDSGWSVLALLAALMCLVQRCTER
ncbi:recombinase family protein [Corynebacterium striatum]|uniref:recombinase family protein n=1 Tax=Corynebacterium striatum TaxID=43770 RepID=UPI003AC005BB